MKAIYVLRQPAPVRRAPGPARRPVAEAMSSPVLCVPADTLLGDASRAMARSGRRHLVVTDGAGRCVGILTDRGLTATWARDPAAFSREPVTTAIGDPPATVGIDAQVRDVARAMRKTGDDAVAVVDANGMPIGIVTRTDLVALLGG